jgi:cytochrome c oxidase cbb3-type subunit 3
MVALRTAALLALTALLCVACEREERDPRPKPVAERDQGEVVLSGGLAAGGRAQPGPDYRDYTENAYHVGEGKRLFEAYNCTGCHAHGGGDIGPPLIDRQWIYGNAPGNIYATIVEGRPNGMPSFRGKIPDQQVWQLVAYVRSMAGLVRKDVAGGRDDDMSLRPAEQSWPRETPRESSPGAPASMGTQ